MYENMFVPFVTTNLVQVCKKAASYLTMYHLTRQTEIAVKLYICAIPTLT
jgi:hypothetical protein